MTDQLKVLPLRENVRCTRVAIKRHFEQEYDEFLFAGTGYPKVSIKKQKSDRDHQLTFNDVGRRECLPNLQKKRQSFLVKGKEMRCFFNLLGNSV